MVIIKKLMIIINQFGIMDTRKENKQIVQIDCYYLATISKILRAKIQILGGVNVCLAPLR